MICVCGHARTEHYMYIRNGKDQMRCKACDPTTHWEKGNYAIDSDSYTYAMMRAADHEYAEATP